MNRQITITMRRTLVAAMLLGSASIAYAGPGKSDFAGINQVGDAICWEMIENVNYDELRLRVSGPGSFDFEETFDDTPCVTELDEGHYNYELDVVYGQAVAKEKKQSEQSTGGPIDSNGRTIAAGKSTNSPSRTPGRSQSGVFYIDDEVGLVDPNQPGQEE